MSYHVFTTSPDGPAHRGAHEDKQDARAVLRTARAGIITSSTGVVLEIRSQTPPAEQRALESFARSFLAAPASTPAAPPKAPRRMVRKALSEGVVSPEVTVPPSPPLATRCADDVHPVGVGAATEPPLPVPFDAPVVEPAPRDCFAERAAALRTEIARGLRVGAAMKLPLPVAGDSTGIPLKPFTSPAFREALHTAKVAGPLHDEIEHLRVQLAEVTARAVAAEEALVAARTAGRDHLTDALVQAGKLRIALTTIAKALRIPANRDPEEIATRALASIKTYALDAKVHGAEIERLQNVVVELHEENKKLHAKAKRSTRGTTKPAQRTAGESPVEQIWRRINERAAGVGR